MDEAYSIRLATLDDLDTIIYHRRSMFLEMGVPQTSVSSQEATFRPWLIRHMQDGSYLGWLATYQTQVVAGAGLWLHSWLPGPFSPEGVRGYICNVFTNPEHRGHRIARGLVQACIDECQRRRLTVVALHASNAGRPIYEKMGFEDTNEMRIYVNIAHP